MLERIQEQLQLFIPAINLAGITRVVLLIVLGLPLAYAIAGWSRTYISRHYSPQQGMIIGKIIQYCSIGLIGITAFHELGFSLAPLLGAAGVIGIAVGFASQTSVSNIISGLFLIGERPFVVGDAIQVGTIIGEVLSIDFLSVKLRTLDNKFVRIPNETIIKSEVTNITHFPIRRLDLVISVAHKEEIGRVRNVLLDVAFRHPLALQEPESIVIFDSFGESSVRLLFVVWAERQDWLKLKNTLPEDIKEAFNAEGIEFAFPHVSLYTGSMSKPFPIQIVSALPVDDPQERED